MLCCSYTHSRTRTARRMLARRAAFRCSDSQRLLRVPSGSLSPRFRSFPQRGPLLSPRPHEHTHRQSLLHRPARLCSSVQFQTCSGTALPAQAPRSCCPQQRPGRTFLHQLQLQCTTPVCGCSPPQPASASGRTAKSHWRAAAGDHAAPCCSGTRWEPHCQMTAGPPSQT